MLWWALLAAKLGTMPCEGERIMKGCQITSNNIKLAKFNFFASEAHVEIFMSLSRFLREFWCMYVCSCMFSSMPLKALSRVVSALLLVNFTQKARQAEVQFVPRHLLQAWMDRADVEGRLCNWMPVHYAAHATHGRGGQPSQLCQPSTWKACK